MFHLDRFTIVASVLAALVLSAPAATTASGDSAYDAAVRAATKTWAEAYNAGDIDRIVALYAEDAILMPPNAPAASGHAAMRAYLTQDREGSKAMGLTLHLEDDGAGVAGDLGWHSGTYTMTDASGKTIERGKWLETWRKTAGKWRMIRDIWNSDLPASGS
jgi:ketosteroid isomerase-like protein